MGRFDFAIPKSLKVRLDIPGYDVKTAAARVERRKERERLDWQRQHSPAQPASSEPNQDAMPLKVSVETLGPKPEPSIVLDLSDIFGGVSDTGQG